MIENNKGCGPCGFFFFFFFLREVHVGLRSKGDFNLMCMKYIQ